MLLLAYLVWVILNCRVTIEILLIGLPVAALGWFFARGYLGWNMKKEKAFYLMLPLVLGYLVSLVFEIIRSSVSVIRYVLAGEDPEGVMVEFSSGLRSHIANAILANSITLTPGTITVKEHDGRFLVCCLSPKYRDGIENIGFIKQLKRLEDTMAKLTGEAEA